MLKLCQKNGWREKDSTSLTSEKPLVEVGSAPENQAVIEPEEDSTGSAPVGYSMLGDNFDKNIHATFLRWKTHLNASLHFFHICAIRDRIDFSHIPKCHLTGCLPSPWNQALALLPTVDDDKAIRRNFIVLASCFLASNMRFFKFTFDGLIKSHIEYKYSKEMATKSI